MWVEPKKKKLSIKKIVLVCLGVIAGLLVIFAVYMWIFMMVAFKTYRNDKAGVEVMYPASWDVAENPLTDVIAAFVSRKDNALDTFYESANFSTFDMSKDPHDTEKYVDILSDQLQMVFGDVKLAEKKPFLVAGRSGYRLVFNVVAELAKVIVVYAFTIDETGYNLLYMGNMEKFSKDLPFMDLMALTLKVNP